MSPRISSGIKKTRTGTISIMFYPFQHSNVKNLISVSSSLEWWKHIINYLVYACVWLEHLVASETC